MAINTGMRQGEIFDLTWFDVDLPRGVIHIRVSKNGKDRFVPINQTVRAMLEGLPHTNEHVFPSPRTKGRLVDVKRRFDLAKSDAGIKDFRFHDLRHTAATRMADCGADAFTLAAIFGWSNRDRKSTRLNSSHSQISYAVFCLKKQKRIFLSS